MRFRTIPIICAMVMTLMCQGTEYDAYIVRLDSDDIEGSLAELESYGIKVLRHRDDLALTFVPLDNGDADGIRRRLRAGGSGALQFERGRRVMPTLDKARTWYDADRIHSGTGLMQPYTGKGVVTGLCDIGFDPMHINFRDSEGNNRIKRVVSYREIEGTRTVLEGDEAYAQWETDDADMGHGTHVAGILAGGYKPGGYYGAACESDIVATTSMCSDVGLLAGVEDIIEYAKEVGKPAVINLSMGSYLGPHDGTSLFCQYMDKLGEEAIICLSSGNEGSEVVSRDLNFTEANPWIRTGVQSCDWVQFNMRGAVECWSDGPEPLKIRMVCMDNDTGKMVFELPWEGGGEPFQTLIDMSENPETASRFTGALLLEGGLSPDNNRYWVRATFGTDTGEGCVNGGGKWAKREWAVDISGEPGAHAVLNCDRQYTRMPYTRDPNIGSKLSVSDLATGHNTICVGMYVNRESLPKIDGTTSALSEKVGTVDRRSGYGTLIDGRTMPHTVAPGFMLVSSGSGPYVRKHLSDNSVCHRSVVDGKTYDWIADGGTSMSSPYVAGFIATWLEANPNLTVSDVQNILELTNDKSHDTAENPRNGNGWFRPFEGLEKAIDRTSVIGGVDDEYGRPRMQVTDEGIRVWNPAAAGLRLTVTTADGRLVMTKDLDGERYQDIRLPRTGGIVVARLESGLYSPVTLKARF